MTKTNENATVNQVELNFDKMAKEYFYPDILMGDLSTIEIPTVDELKFIGVNNVIEIRKHFRFKEDKIWKRLNHARYMLNTGLASQIHNTELSCDWHGADSLKPTPHKFDGLSPQARKKLADQAHSCRFGREIAAWCNRNPQPCTRDDNGCLLCEVTKITNKIPTTNSKRVDGGEPKPSEKCAHYNACFGDQPFKDMDCIFKHDDGSLEASCREHLKNVIEECSARQKLIAQYITALTMAKHDSDCKSKPIFSLCIDKCLQNAERGTAIILLDRDDFMYGTYLGMSSHTSGVLVHNVSTVAVNGGYLQLLVGKLINLSGPVCLTRSNFEYLLEHEDFRKVWLRMVTNPLNLRFVDDIGALLAKLSEILLH